MAYDDTAKIILKNAYNRIGSYEKVATLYDTHPQYVRWAVSESERGFESTVVRKIMRAHMAHIQAEQRQELLEVLDSNSKYKGNREVSPSRHRSRLEDMKPL